MEGLRTELERSKKIVEEKEREIEQLKSVGEEESKEKDTSEI